MFVIILDCHNAILGMEHKTGLIRVMDDKCSSADLAIALKGNTKIIATTIQKFPYIVNSVSGLKEKKFAVIIDEAHSSTSGKDMAAITMTLGRGEVEIDTDGAPDAQDVIADELARNGKQPNVSMFAFTATPKATTLQLFGKENAKGQKQAFHIYSMKQAIEEGFILDVLQNFTEYKTFYQINKEVEEDPRCKTSEAKRQIARFVELHETNIAQRIEVIIEHFRTTVMQELGGRAKAMVITKSRESAVKYHQAFEDYIAKKGYSDIKSLVAFSGKVKVDNIEYSESGINGFSEERLPKEFEKDDYKVLLVANKYQTGFDQPKLCAMYVLKKLRGVNAVQTLSRLNRICPPFDKNTFILDFVNTYDDIVKAFEPYYTTTLLANSVTPSAVYDLEAKLDGYYILDPNDIEQAAQLLYGGDTHAKTKEKLNFYFGRAKKRLEEYDFLKQLEIAAVMRHFVRFYQFLIQVSCFEDIELHKKYLFVDYLLSYIDIRQPGRGYDLDGKIKASNFVQKKGDTHVKERLNPNPVIKLPTADAIALPEDKQERLSVIIAEINSRTGKAYDNDVAIKIAPLWRQNFAATRALYYCFGGSIQMVKLMTSLIYLLRPIALRIYVNRHYSIDRKIKYDGEPIKQKWNGMAQHIAAVVLDGTDTIVLTLFSTLSNVSIYSVYHMVVYNVKNLFLSLTNGMKALMGELWAKKENEKLKLFFRKVQWVLHTGTVYIFGCCALLILPFVQVYTNGITDADYYQPLFACLITAANAVHCLRLPYNIVILAAGDYKNTQSCYIIATILNIVISVVTVFFWGLIGVAIGTLVAMAYQTIWMAVYNSKHLIKGEIKSFIKQIIIDTVTVALMWAATMWIDLISISYLSWFIMALEVAGISFAVVAAINLIFYRNEIIDISKFILRKLHKKNTSAVVATSESIKTDEEQDISDGKE